MPAERVISGLKREAEGVRLAHDSGHAQEGKQLANKDHIAHAGVAVACKAKFPVAQLEEMKQCNG
jgi:hypothetical protein